MATLTSLSFRLNSFYSGDGLRQARADIQRLDTSMNAQSKAMKAVQAGVTSMTNVLLGLGPAIVPVVGGLAALGGAAVSAFALAGAAVGIFGAALKGAIDQTIGANSAVGATGTALDTARSALSKTVEGTKAYTKAKAKVTVLEKAHEAAIKALPPVQEKFARSVDGMKSAWEKFIQGTTKYTLKPATTMVQAATLAMPQLVSVVAAVAPEMQRVADATKNWVQNGGLERFLTFVKTYGVPALRGFIDGIRSLLATFGSGLREFAPLGLQFVGWLKDAFSSLQQWSDGGGFQRFLQWFQENQAALLSGLQSLTTFLGNLGTALGEMSGMSFSVVLVFLQVLASFPVWVIEAMVYGFLALKAALLAYAIVAGIAAAATTVMTLAATPFGLLFIGMALTIGLVVLALIALGVGIFFLVKHWDTVWSAIKTAWFATWDAIKASATAVWNFITHGWGQLVLALLGPIGALIFLYTHWKEIWSLIKAAAAVVWDALKAGWETFSGWMTSAWKTVWGGLLTAYHGAVDPIMNAWNAIWPEARAAAENVWKALTIAWNAVMTAFKAAWDWFWGLFGPSIKQNWEGVKAIFTVAVAAISAVWTVFWTQLTGIAKVAWAALSAVWNTIWSGLTGIAQIAWAVLTGAWGVVWAVIKGVWDVFSSTFMALVSGFWNVLKTVVLGVWDLIKAAWDALWKVVTAVFLVFFAIFTGHWGKAWDAIKSAVSAVWDLIVAGWNLFWGAISSVFMMFWGAITTGWGALWDAIKSVVFAVWDLIKGTFEAWIGAFVSTWSTAWNGVKTVWDTVWGAVTATAMALYNNIIKPIADAFMWLWNFLIGNSIIPDIVNGIIYWFNLFTAPVKAVLDFMVNLFVTAWNLIWTGAQAIWALFVAGVTAFLNGVQVIWNTIWNAIVAVAKVLWAGLQAAAQAVWTAISAAVSAFLNGLKVIWETVWNGIKAFATTLWNGIKVAFDAWVAAFKAVFTAFINGIKLIWETVWNAIKAFGQTLWNGIKVAFDAWVAAFKAVFTAFLNGIKVVWETIWNGIKAFATTLWNGIKAVFDGWVTIFKAAFSAFLNGIKVIWETIWNAIKAFATTAWNSLVTLATGLWDKLKALFDAGSTWIRTTFWNPISTFFTKTMPGAWDAAVKAIGTAWDKLKQIVRAPIQAVVDVVYNNGIVKMWNLVAKAFSAPTLSTFSLPAFEKGGPTGSGSASGFPAILHPDEHVWTAAEVAGAGGHEAVAKLRRRAMNGVPVRTYGTDNRFADGGGFLGTGWGSDVGPDLVPDGIVKNAWGGLKDLALGAISGPFNKAVDGMVSAAQSVIRGIVPGSGSSLEEVGVGIPKKIGDVAKSWVKSKDVAPTIAGGTVEGALAWARTQNGLPYQWGGNGNPSWDCSGLMSAIESVIRGEKPHRRWATMAFSGEAAPPGWKLHEKAPFMVGITAAGVGHTAGTLNNVNVESSGGVGVRIGGGARGYNNGLFSSWYGFVPSKTAGGPKEAGPLPAYGRGTYSASPGWSVVGDQGPELMRMRGGEQIKSNADSQELLLGRGGGDTFHVTVPITIQGTATPAVVDRLQRELPDTLRMALAQGTGKRR